MEKPLVIVGIDPGTTVGYAVLDLNGNILEVSSSKYLDLSSLISLATISTKPIITGSDKKSIPNYVREFSTALQTKLISPKQDLSVKEKKRITSSFNPKNDHERDALAAAILAHKTLKPLIKKLDVFIARNKKQKIADKLKELVIKKGLSIQKTAQMLEKPKEIRVIKEVIERKTPEDYLKLKNAVKNLNKGVTLLKKDNNSLKNKISELINKNKSLTKKLCSQDLPEKITKKFESKNKTIESINKRFIQKEKELQDIQKEINNLYNFLSQTNEGIILKKLNDLTMGEYENKNKILNIKEGDILLVNNPNQYSEKLIELLKNKIAYIITKIPLTKKLQFPFNIIPSKNLKIKENNFFALANKEEFEKTISESNILGNIIESYKKERNE